MRFRTMLGRTCLTTAVVIASVVGLGAPASAGTPYSDECSDGIGFLETPIMTSPYTIGAELNRSPLDTTQQIQICLADSAEGAPGNLIGGKVIVRYDYVLGGTYNWVRLTVQCFPDVGVIWPVCFSQSVVETFPAGIPTFGLSPTTQCLVDLGSGCVLFLSGVWVKVPPILRITLPPAIDVPPAQCIALLATCPP